MNYQGGFETFKEATKYMFESPSLYDVIFVVVGFVFAVGLLIVFPYMWSRYKARIHLKEEFFSTGKNVGLSLPELSLMWKCAKAMDEPTKVLYNKAVFEKCVNKLVKEDISVIEQVSHIRKKLRFDSLPWFLPLSSTKDIDVYQTGFLSFEDVAYSAAVWDKNELELHIAILDIVIKAPKEGDKVKFSFLREDDGRYYFQSEVIRTYKDGTKLVVVVPHTDQLSKIQLREHLRWKVNIPAKVFFGLDKMKFFEEEPEEYIDAVIEDISPQGAKVCVQRFIEAKLEDKIILQFELKSIPIRTVGTIKNIRTGFEKVCFGIKFESIGKAEEDFIRRFILEEQREILKAYKMGEFREGSSSLGP